MAVTKPSATEATSAFDELQVTVLSMASSGKTVAVSVADMPFSISKLTLSRETEVTCISCSSSEQAQNSGKDKIVMKKSAAKNSPSFPP